MAQRGQKLGSILLNKYVWIWTKFRILVFVLKIGFKTENAQSLSALTKIFTQCIIKLLWRGFIWVQNSIDYLLPHCKFPQPSPRYWPGTYISQNQFNPNQGRLFSQSKGVASAWKNFWASKAQFFNQLSPNMVSNETQYLYTTIGTLSNILWAVVFP